MVVPWLDLALFLMSVGLLALYGLAWSGHFPTDHRRNASRTVRFSAVLWGTVCIAAVAALLAMGAAVRVLPWPTIVIGAGAMLLAAPLVLQLFSDRFVNGMSALILFTGSALAISVLLMLLTPS